MAQLNITLNQDEILQLLANDRDSAFKKLLQDSLNSILRNEDSLMRLMGAVLMERNDSIASLRCIFKATTLQERMTSDVLIDTQEDARHPPGQPVPNLKVIIQFYTKFRT